MFCADLIIEGAAGRASRFARQHLADGILDHWLIDLVEPRMFWQRDLPTLRSQATLFIGPVRVITPTRPVGDFPDGAHGAVLALTAETYRVGDLDRDTPMNLFPHPVGYFEGTLRNDHAGRLVGHALAASIVHRDLPLGSRRAPSAFAAAAAAVFRCADMVTVVRSACRSGGDRGDRP